jgi:hypothetical protein
MPATICVLHDRRDRLFAQRLAGDLVALGISARWDMGAIEEESPLGRRLSAGAGTVSVWLVLATHHSVSAPWLAHELPAAFGSPPLAECRVLLGRCTPLALPQTLASMPAVDLTRYSAGLEELLDLM